ncbi:Ribonuclease 2 [Phytophthora nicotianae]|uniref:Ribonuclease 2 n=1 Tax=Phytophthora nicotianae TaxID=4792 RepID=A0A0W8DQ96_PHYNI|nr:Ribonuclease 2 [Phytophthora nicotianae]
MSDHEQHDEHEREHEQGDNEPKKGKQGSGKRLNDRQRVDIIQMAENSKISKRQLAEKFGVSEAAIRKLLRKKDDFLRRYYDTPEELRDQRLRGKSTHESDSSGVGVGNGSGSAPYSGSTTPRRASLGSGYPHNKTSSPKKTQEEDHAGETSSDVRPDVNMDTPTTLLPAPSTITTTTIGAPPAPNAGDDDEEFQISTAAAHMCGHDGHMAMVLGLCAMVVRSAHMLPQDTFVRFLFQPAEEGPGGAMKMIEDGALTDVDEVYGCHNAPFPLYSIHVRPGAVMAHEVEFSIDIHGIGGHGSAPQQCVDPILAGSAVVQALQSVVSRSLSPMDTAVVSVTQFRGGDANNVIPSRVFLGGTIRDFDLQIAEKIKERVAKLVHSTCAAHGATASVHFLDGYAPVINPQVETRQVQQIAMDMGLYVSEEGLPLMAAEDFSYFLQERKGCYFFLGTREDGDPEKMRALHSNHYDFNDKAIPLGIRLFMGILQSRFKCELYTFEEMQAFQVAMERVMINVTVV